MPDRYDPKLSVRPMSDRRGSEAGRGDKAAGEDPLVELAKIVSGRSTTGSPTSQPRRTVPAATDIATPAELPDVLGDLEAELLSDLQASFSTVKGTLARTPPVGPRPVTQPPPARASSPPPQAEAPAKDAPSAPPAKADAAPARPPLRGESTQAQPKPSEPTTPERPADVPSAARPAPSEPPAGPRPTVVERAQPRAASQQPKTAAPRPPQPPRTAAPSDSVDIPNMQLRATTPAAPPPPAEAPSRQPHSRWDKPPEPEQSPSSVASRFAPPRAAAPVPTPPVEPDEEEALGEDFPFTHAADDGTADAQTPFDEFELGPGYGEEDHLPPYPDDELEALIQRRPGRGRIALVAVVAVVLIGGGALVLFRAGDTSDSPPPIITADGSPTKIIPEEESAAADGDQNKLIYDRVASGDTEPDTTLITPGDVPIAEVPAADAGTDDAITRVIIPGGPGIDRPATDTEAGPIDMADGIGTMIDDGGAAPATVETEPIQPIGPRKVRTVVVRPDGTIVSNQATEAGTDETPPSTDVAVAEPEPVGPPPATDDDTMAIAGVGGGTDADGELAITPVPDLPGQADVAARDTVVDVPVGTPAPTGAGAGEEGPIDITPGRPTPRPQVPAPTETAAAVTGGMLVQVSSQRSADAARATFRDLQSRYPGILGSYEVDIQRADLGARGIYYRARVGPFSPGDAERLCSDLKAAGGDCILARR